MLQARSLKAAAFGLALTAAGWSGEAWAAKCGLQTASGGVANLVYDPFKDNATSLTVTDLVLRRVNGTGGEKTMVIDFFLRPQTTEGNGIQVVVQSATGEGTPYGIGNQIFHNLGGSNPIPSVADRNSAPAGTFMWSFGGNDQRSDNITLGLAFTIPGNLNIPATTTLVFDIVYACRGTGGGNFTESGVFPGAMSAKITVLSALRASYVGTALDFGEIGTIDNATAPTITTNASGSSDNYIRVQSSGAYTVSVTSGNNYRLKHPTGSLANANDRINYQLEMLGETRNEVNTVPITANCARAGIGDSQEDKLKLVARLREGGAGKTPSLGGQYRDELTVTITPKDIGTTYTTNCHTPF